MPAHRWPRDSGSTLTSFRDELRRTLVPGGDPAEGPLPPLPPLPPLLIAMTLVTGLVDAFSFLELGHVFVANMTGNVVFLAFALAGARGFSIGASATALAAFWIGTYVGGRLARHFGSHRGIMLSVATRVQSVFLLVAVIISLVSQRPLAAGSRYPLVVVLAVAMGMQNAMANRMGVTGLTTTVLTSAITGAAADAGFLLKNWPSSVRRYLSVVALFLGAVVGAVLVLPVNASISLIVALCLLIGVALVARRASQPDSPWKAA